MISISPPEMNPVGSIVLHNINQSSDVHTIPNRVSRRKLLDGTVSIYQGGVSDGDRTFNIVSRCSEKDYSNIVYYQRLYEHVIVSSWDGVYIGVIQTVTYKNSEANVIILITRRI